MKRIAVCLLAILLVLLTQSCSDVDTTPSNQSITLTWTATGNEGLIGTAREYDLRWSLDPQTLLDTSASAWAANQRIAGLPAPKPSGQKESYTFTLFCQSNTTYYFAIKAGSFPWKSCDTCTTTYVLWSDGSNIAARFFPTAIKPTKIPDLQ